MAAATVVAAGGLCLRWRGETLPAQRCSPSRGTQARRRVHAAPAATRAAANQYGDAGAAARPQRLEASRRITEARGPPRGPPVLAPSVIGATGPTDLWSHLLTNRIVFLRDQVNDKVATRITAEMLALEAMDPTRDIKLYINCLGGSMYSILSIFDMMQAIRPDVQTVCFGQAVSHAALLLAAGTKGKRFAMANSRIMIHQPMGGLQGEVDDVIIQATEINRQRAVVDEIYQHITGKPIEEVKHFTDRDYFMGPEKALEFGLIDGII
eukprot:jgi/Chlat1/820/Chrsp104S01271